MSEPTAFHDAVVVSDLHLWDVHEPRYHEAVRFLGSIPASVDLVVILGDLFDFWLGRNRLLADRFGDVIDAIRALRERGVTVLYCEGNHDLYLDPFFGGVLGCETFLGERRIDVAGLAVDLSHGDLVNPHDRGYLFLRWFLRTPFVRLLVALTPARVHVAIGSFASRTSRAFTAKKDDPIRELSLAYADRRIAAGADVVVIGHTHRPERVERQAGGRRGIYLNTGFWQPDGARHWARIDGSGVALLEAR